MLFPLQQGDAAQGRVILYQYKNPPNFANNMNNFTLNAKTIYTDLRELLFLMVFHNIIM